jgi:Icc-related predicted phosphoesterase
MKNLILVDRKKARTCDFDIIGHGRYLDPTEYIKNPIDKLKSKQKKRLARYLRDEKKLDRLLKKEKLGKFIFLTHYPPYGLFDKAEIKGSPMYGKHLGFQPYNKLIKKYRPFLVVFGHMHENQGKKRIGKIWFVNPGSARNGGAALIELDGEKVKNIKFLK